MKLPTIKPKAMTDLKNLVDDFGKLKAEISALTEKEKIIRDKLVASGLTEINGNLFRATISKQERSTLDSAKVRALLAPAQLIACTVTAEVTMVKCNALKR
jgi:hypothetical protein